MDYESAEGNAASIVYNALQLFQNSDSCDLQGLLLNNE